MQKINHKSICLYKPYIVIVLAAIISVLGYVNSCRQTAFLEQELVRVEKEIYLKNTVYQKRMKALSKKCKGNRLQTAQMLTKYNGEN